jgi:two-component system sensor histidine kinase BaeS
MRRLAPRLLLSQIGISFLVSFLLGFSTLTLARAYFIDSLESALDVQAMLISEALFSGDTSIELPRFENTEFNTLQQEIGNLAVEIEGLSPEQLSDASTLQSQPQRIQAIESIDLAVKFVNSAGETIIQSSQADLPEKFGGNSSSASNESGFSKAVVQSSIQRDWLVKSYPVLDQDSYQGILTLGQPLEALQAILVDLGWRIAAAGLVAVGIASIISIFTARGLLAPITALMQASQSITQGRFDEPLPLDRGDELGELSRTFEEMRSKLSALETLRSQFISDVSHELRTPLTAIKGLAETLQDGAVEDPKVRDRFLASIEQETDRLIRMTQDLLTLTRVDAKDLSLNFSPQDLLDILEETLITLKAGIEAKEIRINFEKPLEKVPIAADKDRLIQILFNLLDNAIQHSPQKGELDISIKCGPIRLPEIMAELHLPLPVGGLRPAPQSLDRERVWGILRIQDYGPGIDPPDLPHIFDRFYRADIARVRSKGGAGLGLSIAQALVKAHDAFLWIHSPISSAPDQHHQGTLAILMFPLTPAS